MKELSLNILDIVQNSIRAGADEITIEIFESPASNLYRVMIEDNGSGISEEILDKVTDPFVTTRTTRKTGLGLPLLKYHAELTGGKLKIESERGSGTSIIAEFRFDHIDRQPLGDIVGVIKILIASNTDINFIYRHISEEGEYVFSSGETKDFLETETLSSNSLLNDIGIMISENLKIINASGFSFKL